MLAPTSHPWTTDQSLGEHLTARGVSRREFLDLCGKLTATLGLASVVTPRMAEALAQMLSANTPLRVLDLGHNKFGSAGASCIAVALQVRIYTSTLGTQQTRGLYKRNSHRSTLCAAQFSPPRTRSFWQPIV